MALTAGGIIDQARGRSPAFDLTRHPNKVVLQYLSSYVRELHGKVAQIDAEALRSEVSQNLPLADHEAGVTLPENRLVVEVVAFDSAEREYPIDLVNAVRRLDRNVRSASCWQIGSKLHLTSPASLWTKMVRLGIALVATPAGLTALTATIPLPDAAERALVEKCAYFMARRHPVEKDGPVVNVEAIGVECLAAEEAYLADVANRLTSQTFLTRDTYQP